MKNRNKNAANDLYSEQIQKLTERSNDELENLMMKKIANPLQGNSTDQPKIQKKGPSSIVAKKKKSSDQSAQLPNSPIEFNLVNQNIAGNLRPLTVDIKNASINTKSKSRDRPMTAQKSSHENQLSDLGSGLKQDSLELGAKGQNTIFDPPNVELNLSMDLKGKLQDKSLDRPETPIREIQQNLLTKKLDMITNEISSSNQKINSERPLDSDINNNFGNKLKGNDEFDYDNIKKKQNDSKNSEQVYQSKNGITKQVTNNFNIKKDSDFYEQSFENINFIPNKPEDIPSLMLNQKIIQSFGEEVKIESISHKATDKKEDKNNNKSAAKNFPFGIKSNELNLDEANLKSPTKKDSSKLKDMSQKTPQFITDNEEYAISEKRNLESNLLLEPKTIEIKNYYVSKHTEIKNDYAFVSGAKKETSENPLNFGLNETQKNDFNSNNIKTLSTTNYLIQEEKEIKSIIEANKESDDAYKKIIDETNKKIEEITGKFLRIKQAKTTAFETDYKKLENHLKDNILKKKLELDKTKKECIERYNSLKEKESEKKLKNQLLENEVKKLNKQNKSPEKIDQYSELISYQHHIRENNDDLELIRNDFEKNLNDNKAFLEAEETVKQNKLNQDIEEARKISDDLKNKINLINQDIEKQTQLNKVIKSKIQTTQKSYIEKLNFLSDKIESRLSEKAKLVVSEEIMTRINELEDRIREMKRNKEKSAEYQEMIKRNLREKIDSLENDEKTQEEIYLQKMRELNSQRDALNDVEKDLVEKLIILKAREKKIADSSQQIDILREHYCFDNHQLEIGKENLEKNAWKIKKESDIVYKNKGILNEGNKEINEIKNQIELLKARIEKEDLSIEKVNQEINEMNIQYEQMRHKTLNDLKLKTNSSVPETVHLKLDPAPNFLLMNNILSSKNSEEYLRLTNKTNSPSFFKENEFRREKEKEFDKDYGIISEMKNSFVNTFSADKYIKNLEKELEDNSTHFDLEKEQEFLNDLKEKEKEKEI